MLILTRRIGERLVIDGHIYVRILGVKGNQVRLGIDAPEDIPVHREEIQEKIDAEMKAERGFCTTIIHKRRNFWNTDEPLALGE